MLNFVRSIFLKRKIEKELLRHKNTSDKNRKRFDSIHSDKKQNGLSDIYRRLKIKDSSLSDAEILSAYKKFSDSIQTNTFSAAELELVSISVLCHYRVHLTEQLLKQSLKAILWSLGEDIDSSIVKQYIDQRILSPDNEPYGGLPDAEGIHWLSNIVNHETELTEKLLTEAKGQTDEELSERIYNFDILWNDKKIGCIENCIPDMAYLEGKWISNNSDQSLSFEKLVSTFKLKEIMQDPTKGTRIVLTTAHTKEIHALVQSMENGNLFIRRVFDKEGIEWLLKNVK